MKPLTVGSLFSGIGGLELGLERAGMKVVWQVEKDEYCRKVLAKHWPDVPKYEDVRNVGKENLAPVDLICGGFPCQDISSSGHKVGIAGARSGLWYEYVRIVGELRPRYILVENVSALLDRGMGAVLGTLSTIGYDAEWSVVPACAVGAPHPRERVFILAYPTEFGRAGRTEHHGPTKKTRAIRKLAAMRFHKRVSEQGAGRDKTAEPRPHEAWATGEPEASRVVDGIPSRLDNARVFALGNAVVPQVAELIGHWIVEADNASQAGAA